MINLHTLKKLRADFILGVIYLATLRLTNYLSKINIQNLSTSGCFIYLQVEWTGVLLTDNVAHANNYPQKDTSQY